MFGDLAKVGVSHLSSAKFKFWSWTCISKIV